LQLKSNAVVFGEVGLSGEVRHVPYAEKRIAEAKKLGFEAAIGPQQSAKKATYLIGVKNVREALNQFLKS
jgi:DNA repair protein RadA/Sms